MEREASKALSDYAAKFGVVVTVEQYGIYGDEWDLVARPAQPNHYPAVEPYRVPVGTDERGAVRHIACAMGTGKWHPGRLNCFIRAK